MFLNEIKAKEYEYPNQVHKVPVQTSLFDHQVMTPSLKGSVHGHDQHDNVDDHAGEYVETMEAGDTEEVSAKGNRTGRSNMVTIMSGKWSRS